MKSKVFYRLATILAALAVAVVSSASWMYFHQDETPEELLK
ncbi:cyclic lactone autoinducer peptide [Paenibacillus tarimensis]|nr:cyclic lactone autoinducer peptide [Paenibacillus tarimensis]MCF2943421.1 cyclic lactone autoinducer peptide [Paenibacillus tarimensis]